ncbi:hypothetical protein A3C37_05160 [Candidatus Peribacteria bacterium RIFCSPHIGHO2_02_FULL_53_20]|nr:MAG: hypothetical protein A3C37_05160 [Candidatus Peribacteria bacterium RIFCSPHIGHO2_02_FULL_53_20]
MMLDLGIAILVFVYESLVLLGAGVLTGRLIAICMGRFIPQNSHLLLGFAIFPVLVTWGGYIGIWQLPAVTEIVGIICVIAAMYALLKSAGNIVWTDLCAEGSWYIVPAIVLIMLFWMKSGYLLAGHSHADEGRSILFVSTFAHSALKPAYLFDISMPVAYPYYLFQSAAFAYRSVGGFLYPTIPLFAATLFAVFFSFRAMHLAARELFGEKGNRLFVVAMVILVFSSLQAYGRFLGKEMPYLFSLTVNPINEYWHAGYHYILGISLAVLGVAHLWTFMLKFARDSWRMFVLCICLAFGYAGIPILWMIAGIFCLLGLFLIHNRMNAVGFFLKEMPFSLLIWSGILLQQIFNFLPRVVPQFSFSMPHPWYLRDVQILIAYTGESFLWLKQLLLGHLMIIRGAGIFVFISLPISVVTFFRYVRSFTSAPPIFPFSVIITTAILILTCTTSITSDWFSRGFIGTIIVGSFVTAYALLPFIFTKKYAVFFAIIAVPLFILHGISFILEYRQPHFHPQLPHVRAWNQYPLETTFYSKQFKDKENQILFAGRHIITMPPAPFFAYFLHPDTYHKLGTKVQFTPCKRTWFGSNTPLGSYVNIDTETPKVVHCTSVR